MADQKAFVYEEDKPGRTILWPCPIQVPVDNGVEERMMTAKFSLDHVDEDAHAALWDEAAIKPDGDKYFLEQVVAGFDGVTDDHGVAVPDEKVMKLAMSKRYIKTGLMTAYLQMRAGRLPKNFGRPSASS